MGEQDVLVEVIINGRDMLQFYSTPDHYKTLYEDRDALFTTVKTAFKEGILSSEFVKNIEDIHSVKFLSEVTEETIELGANEEDQEVDVHEGGEEYEAYEIIEETAMENLTSSELPEELIIDVGLSSDERLNLCAYCDYRTFNVGHFKIHMRQHTGESPFQCDICDYKSKQKSNLKRHMKQHLLGKDHYECKMCNFTCTQEKVYKRHMILHSRTRPLRPCPFCDYFSTSLAHLTVHIRQHTGETPYHCGLCTYKTVQKSNLTRHLKKHRRGRVSKADKLRCCLYCSYRTPNPAHLMAHIRAAHTGETPYACEHCNYKSAQRSNLKRHLRKHSGERPYKCHLCTYSTAYPYVLKKHIENHPPQDESLTCEECEYQTTSHTEFKRHVRLHTGKTLYCCHICGYVSINSDHLKIHIRKHSMEKPFKCDHCNYSSSQKSNLKRHLEIKHNGVSQNDDGIKASNSAEEHERNVGEEMECEDEEGSLGRDPTYIDELNVQVQMDSRTHPDDRDRGVLSENENVTSEVVNEEHVITTPMEEGDYEVLEEYDEGTGLKTYLCMYCSFQSGDMATVNAHMQDHEGELIYKCHYCDFRSANKSVVTRHSKKHLGVVVNGAAESGTSESEVENSNKSKKLGFLNKNQTEKLKEFKRLLQEGTQGSHGPQTFVRTIKEEKGVDHDNASEKTESCTEDPAHDEDFQETSTTNDGNAPGRKVDVKQAINKDPSRIRNVNEEIEEMIEGSSVLIVDRERNDSDLNEYEEVDEYEEIEAEAEGGDSADVEEERSSSQTHTCELCGYETFTLAELKVHIGFHTGESVAPSYSCDLCSFKALRKNDVNRHKSIFHGAILPENRLPFVCRICGNRSASKEEFAKHYEEHNKVTMLKCKICDLKVITPDELRNHSRSHIGEEPFECYYCAYLTARKCHLRKHMKRRHKIDSGGKGPPYACYTCDYRTAYRADFHKHLEGHQVEVESLTPQIYRCSFDHCRFLTMDEGIYTNHIQRHDSNRHREKSHTNDRENEVLTEDGRLQESITERVPLKERIVNIHEHDMPITVKGHVSPKTTSLLNTSPQKKSLIREDYSPLKRRKRGLKSLVGGRGEPLIETRLKRKFNFDVKNLALPSPEETLDGFSIDFHGEVLKSHGCLRKYTRYGEFVKKSDNEIATVMANPENEKQLKRIYDQIKDLLSSMESEENKEKLGNARFTIFFKELNDYDAKPGDDSLSDFDISLSSDNDSIDSLESDLDLEGDLSDISLSAGANSIPSIEKTLKAVLHNGSRQHKPDASVDFNDLDKMQIIQKIREKNEKRKELRRLKVLKNNQLIHRKSSNDGGSKKIKVERRNSSE